MFTLALAGIPNSGKTTLFNQLTGSHQIVGNWPGVTVEKKEGTVDLDGTASELIDLPGTYSLIPHTLEEKIVLDFFITTPPDCIINIADGTNLFRSLGLTLYLAAMGTPMVVCINMMDEVREKGIDIDFKKLSDHLGCPVVPISARSGEGLETLKERIEKVCSGQFHTHPVHISMPKPVESEIFKIKSMIESAGIDSMISPFFLSIVLLESKKAGELATGTIPQLKQTEKPLSDARQRLERYYEENAEVLFAETRFSAVKGLLKETVSSLHPLIRGLSEKVDDLLLHKILGLPLFFLILFLLFIVVYYVGAPLQEWLAEIFDTAAADVSAFLTDRWAAPILISLISDGLINGVGLVVSFTPLIAVFFVSLTALEESGYMARAAFIMDRLMHTIGLDGKTFINVVMGFGCNVPAIMGTRALASQSGRMRAIILIPFSLCTARLQVFIFMAGALFRKQEAPILVFFMYVLSFLLILGIGLILKAANFCGGEEPFVMELPCYRVPRVRNMIIRSWQEVKIFLSRAGTTILAGVIVVWFLVHYPFGIEPASSQSLAGRIGLAVEPAFLPIGLSWKEVLALLFGFIAKEIVIASLAIIYNAGQGGLVEAVRANFSQISATSFMVFTLVYTPCIATLGAIRLETNSWKMVFLSLGISLSAAWLLSFVVYQAGSYLLLP